MNVRAIFAAGAVFCTPLLAEPATAGGFSIQGTFETLSGSPYEVLSGGSFEGSFILPDSYFQFAPLPPGTNDYLYNAPFHIDIFNAAGTKVTTLENQLFPPDSGIYIQLANTDLDIYGGLRIFFRVSATDYLQLVMPLDFSGAGDIAPVQTNYALVLGDDYAYIRTGRVNSVPEPASWAMMLIGMGAVGLTARRRPRAIPSPA